MVDWRISCKLALGLALSMSVPLFAQSVPGEPPPGPGLELIQRSCVNCHDISIITLKRRTPDEWAEVVGLMADRGAEVTPDEMQIIEDYLTRNFSASAPRSVATH